MDKPSQPYPTTTVATSVPSPLPPLIPDPSILGQAFDQLLNQRGIRMLHSKAMPCPNLQSVDTNAHDPNCEFCDNNGFIHYDEKEIWGTFAGNSIQKVFEAHGVWEIGSAVVTMPTEYQDGVEADFQTYDRLFIPDFTVRLWEEKAYEPRPGNIQELRYPIQKVDRAVSIVDGQLKIYELGVQFNLDSEGRIVWVNGQEPKYDADTQLGEVISWSFYAQPVYYVVQTLRELRITQELTNAGKVAKRLPQQILVKRDFLPGRAETVANP